jgi:glutamate synthase (NADPH/NADH) large chain
MADLGFRTINDMVGRVQFLKVRDNLKSWKAKKIDLSGILHPVTNARGVTLYNSEKQDHGMADIIDWKLLEAAKPRWKIKPRYLHHLM